MRYKTEKNYWQLDIRRSEYVKAFGQGVFLVGLVSYLFYGTFWLMILFSPYLFWHMKNWKKDRILRKQQNFRFQFKEMIQSLESALSVGYSLENALKEADKDLHRIYKEEDMILRELSFMMRQVQMNIPVEQTFRELSERVQDEDVETFVTVFAMAKRSGGDAVEIIRNAVRQMGEKIDVEREIVTIMAAKKLEFRIMTLIPFGMILYLRMSFPEFFQVLYGNPVGVVVMSICLLIYLIAYLCGKKMVEIEV